MSLTRAPTQTARSGVECTNHEATAPPTRNSGMEWTRPIFGFGIVTYNVHCYRYYILFSIKMSCSFNFVVHIVFYFYRELTVIKPGVYIQGPNI